ncbi:MAG: phytanoyl-CoA dioxygenase family protein [Acidimicrobiales bacterium]
MVATGPNWGVGMERNVTGDRVDGAATAAALAELARDGVTVLPGVLTAAAAAAALEALWGASAESERRGVAPHVVGLDPNDRNVRVFNLIDLDPCFADLIAHPVVEAVIGGLLGVDYIVSNFSANIARPGSESMVVHSDLGAVMPEPWTAPQSANAIWCLSDVHGDNGATLYLPGSHRLRTQAELPDDPVAAMVPFEAAAGSVIVMEGRIWHTSGRNVTSDEDRALLFGYYTQPFLRPQWNFTRALRPEVQAGMSNRMRYRLGLDAQLNMPNEAIFGDLAGRSG